jgi:hypothetical protein
MQYFPVISVQNSTTKLNMKPQHRKSVKNNFFIFTARHLFRKAVELMIVDSVIFYKIIRTAEADKLLTLKLEGSVG